MGQVIAFPSTAGPHDPERPCVGCAATPTAWDTSSRAAWCAECTALNEAECEVPADVA